MMPPADRDNKYTFTLASMPDAAACYKVVKDRDGQLMDYICLEANKAFAEMTGLSREKLIGKKITEILPGIEKSDFDWIGIFAKVALGGESIRFEQYMEFLNRWYDITAYSGEQGFFTAIYRHISAQKQLEQSLRESELRYNAILSSFPDLMFIFDRRGTYLDYHVSNMDLLAVQPQQFLGKSVHEVLPADLAERFIRYFEQADKTKHTQVMEYALDVLGGYKHFEGRITPMDNQRLLAVVRDITEQKQGEADLRRSERNYREIFNSTKDAIVIHDSVTAEIIDANDAALNIYGYADKDDLLAVNMDDLSNAAAGYTLEKAQAMVHAALLSDTETFEWQAKHKSGRAFWIEVSLKKAQIGDNERVLAVVRDITERKHMEEVLRESEERFRYLAEFSPLPLLIIDGSGKYEYINPKFTEVFGYTLAEIPSGKIWFKLAYPDPTYRRQVIEIWEKDIRELGKAVIRPRTLRVTCKNGLEKEILFRPVLMDNGKHLLTCEDITERREAEQQLAAYTLELEQLYHQLDEEMNRAIRIHERTLPRTAPAVKGLTLAAHYQPARRLGGDFYNVIRTGQKLVLYISDVSGHGIEGTIVSAFVKEAINSYVSLKPDQVCPENILRHLDRQYRRENFPDDYFFCIFLAVLDLQTMELSYTAAGFQTSPLLQAGNGGRGCLLSKGPPISAAIPQALMTFASKQITITPGTTLLFTTDGLTEHAVGEEQYGSNLEEIFYEHSQLPPEVIVSAINEDFRRFNNGLLQGEDDISFGLIQMDPARQFELNLELESRFAELDRLQRVVYPAVSAIHLGGQFLAGLHELTANAIEHGNRFAPDKKIAVKIIITATYMYARIKDQGEGFNWRAKYERPFDLEGTSERGRGIAMTRSFSNLLFYNEKGNRVSLTIKTG